MDFRSEECIELLKQADIVVTNPPFSLFREYIDQLVKYDKQFLVVGNMGAVSYKNIFPLVKDNKIWLGWNNGPKEYGKPDGTKQKLGNTGWFTNLKHNKRNEELFLFRSYSPAKYPKYDNYDAINVDKVADIPKDYDGYMGVPITFLDKYNPDQFEIIGLTKNEINGILPTKTYGNYVEVRQDGSKTGSSGNKANYNPVVEGKPDRLNYFVNKDGHIVHSKYARVIIRRR